MWIDVFIKQEVGGERGREEEENNDEEEDICIVTQEYTLCRRGCK